MKSAQRRMHAMLNVECPSCHSGKGDPCRSSSNRETTVHVGRIQRYNKLNRQKAEARLSPPERHDLPEFINVYQAPNGKQFLGLPYQSRDHARGARCNNWFMKPVCMLAVYPKSST